MNLFLSRRGATMKTPRQFFAGSSPGARDATHVAAGLRRNERRESVKGRHMARALLGHLPTSADRYLVAEVARLKARVRDLEAELADVRAAHESERLLDELHRITSDASALA